MAASDKVIITCAVTGAIHTPTMSPYLPITPDQIAARSDRRRRSGRRDPASARARSGNRQARPDAGSLRPLPAAHQAGHQCGDQHHHRRQPLHDGGGAGEAGRDLQAGGGLAQHGLDQFRALPSRCAKYKTSSSIGRSRISRLRATWCSATASRTSNIILATCYDNGTRFEFECYDIAHLYNLAHFADRGLVKPPLFVQSVFGILGGIGTHPEDVVHMKRTADRLFGDSYRWSVLGAGASQLRIAAQAAAMGGNVRVGLEDSLWAGQGKLAKSNAEQVMLARKIIEGLGMSVATPDEAREILELKGGDKVAF